VNSFRTSSSHVHRTVYRTVRPRRAPHREAHFESRLLHDRGADAARAAAPAHRAGQHADCLRVSGYFGAGTVTGPNDEAGRPTTLAKVTAESLRGGLKPYALTDHIHEREARRHLSSLLPSGAPPLQVAFTHAVAPWFSGVLALASVPLAAPLAARDVWALFEAKYKGERLVRLQRDSVVLPDVERRHGVCVGGVQVQSAGERVVVTGGLDNLLKGAATQCLQVRGGCDVMSQIDTDARAELNLVLGYDE
jgi:N-acetyl-gamma-glutamylphosphate reductase